MQYIMALYDCKCVWPGFIQNVLRSTLLRANKTTKGHIQFLTKRSKKKTAFEHFKQHCV